MSYAPPLSCPTCGSTVPSRTVTAARVECPRCRSTHDIEAMQVTL
jgi:DNA-directed RNA polymerase subunit RPC12/RpoP